jgi:hypothetical protein
MEDVDLRVDGNAVAGMMNDVFAFELTTARGTCASCGAVGEVGVLHAYVQAPGAVLRCPRCQAVLMRVVRSDERLWFEVRGMRSLEVRAEAA